MMGKGKYTWNEGFSEAAQSVSLIDLNYFNLDYDYDYD